MEQSCSLIQKKAMGPFIRIFEKSYQKWVEEKGGKRTGAGMDPKR